MFCWKICRFNTNKNCRVCVFLISCDGDYTFDEREDETLLRSDGEEFYPLENSERYIDYGVGKKQGSVLGADIYSVEGTEDVLLMQRKKEDIYFVSEELRGLNKLFEDCDTFFYVPAKELNKSGRIPLSYKPRLELTLKDAEDFAFYIFYGRSPEEYGYKNGEYMGEIYATFPEAEALATRYSLYYYSGLGYSIEIDGDEYLLEDEWAKKIGI